MSCDIGGEEEAEEKGDDCDVDVDVDIIDGDDACDMDTARVMGTAVDGGLVMPNICPGDGNGVCMLLLLFMLVVGMGMICRCCA